MNVNQNISFDYSVVVPVYNGAPTLEALYQRVEAVFTKMGASFEVVFIEDCGRDNSWEVISQLQARYPSTIIGIKLARNFGQHNAIMCGFNHVRGRYIVTIDDDLQIPPEQIPILIETQKRTGADLVYGIFEEKKHSLFRNAGSWLIQQVYARLFYRKGQLSAFRLITRTLVDNVTRYRGSYVFIDGFLSWNTQRIEQVYVEHHKRQFGQSNYNIRKLAMLSLNLFLNFSFQPLRMFTIIGFVIASISFLGGVILLFRYMMGWITVPGYSSIFLAVTFFGGLQLVFLGVMSEYLGRVFMAINSKPQFAIQQLIQEQYYSTTNE